MMKILIVENDTKIAALLNDYFVQANFSVSILERGDTVVSYVKRNPPNAILLDIMLQEKDGFTICREIRSFSNVPIIMISARVDEIDRLLGLELGADDYICKPFNPREVVARVRAVLRRSNVEHKDKRLALGPITVDVEGHKASVGNIDMHLTPMEFELLSIMLSRAGRVFTRSELISRIQGYNYDGYDRSIDSHIKNLRKKVDEILPCNNVIQTVYGIGYSVSLPRMANAVD